MSEHAFQAPSPEHLAALLTQYDLEFFIAQGGMGAVYKGRQLSLDRDIKPSNILLTRKAEPKVADFGLAHAADSDRPGLVMGPPGYTAPEVFQNPETAGTLADIYSVGVILHQLLTGIDPAGSMVPPSQPTGSLRLDAIWRKATHVNPSQRYPDIVAMSADLEKWIAAKQKISVPPSRSPAPYSPQSRPVSVGSDSGGGMGKLLVIGVLVVLVAIAGMALMQRKSGLEEPVAGSSLPDTAELPEVDPSSLPVSQPPVAKQPVTETRFIPAEEVEDEEQLSEEEETEDEPQPAEETPVAELMPGDPELRERAIGLIGESRKKRDKELADNASALHFTLKAQSRDATEEVVELVDVLKGDIVDDRIPQIDGVTGLPDAMERAFEDALAKEGSIEERYRSDLMRIRDAYVTRLEGAAESTADKDLKKRLIAQAGQAADLDAWIGLLAPEPERVVKRRSGGVAGGFAGNWDIHSEGKVSRWIGHPDGRLEIVGQKWVASWIILEGGTLELRWAGKGKPYVLEREGEDWVGKSPFGHPVTLKPGDW